MHLYRPQRTSAELLEKTSVAREPLVSEIVERLARWTPGASRQHYLLIGPRGIGKTHLLRLVEHRIQTTTKLELRWTPIALAEDFYSITRVSDLLLEMLRILGEERRIPDAEEVFQEIRYDDDDERVCDRCLDAFRHFHRETRRGVLLMIENLDRLLERQIRTQIEKHRLRRILLEEDWLVTICTSPTYLNAVTNEEDPFFEFFQVHALAELTAVEQEEMLRRLAAADSNTEFDVYLGDLRSRLRALYHFTGGNPRLTVMLYDLLAHKKVGNVRSGLDLLLDQLTPFYQDRMKEISELEAKVLEVMTLLPEGCTPSELAQEARLSPKVVRATLTRLERSGYVRREQRRQKRTVYIVPERFFRIWHQMNHSRAARGRIQYLLEFFSSWYASREERDRVWDELTEDFRRGTAKGDDERIDDIAEYMSYVVAVSEGAERFERAFERLQRLASTGHEDSVGRELSELDREHAEDGDYFIYKGYFLTRVLKQRGAALTAFQSAIELKRSAIFARYKQAVALEKKGWADKALIAFQETAAHLATDKGQGGLPRTQPALLDILLQFLRTGTDPKLAQMSAYLLGRLADAPLANDVITILQNSCAPWRRRHCATALGLLAAEEAHEVLVRCLEDPEAEVRGSAATALGRIGNASVDEPLIHALDDQANNVRGSAATALGRIAGPSAVEPLMRALDDQANNVRGSAATALGRIADPSAVEPLIRVLDDPANNVRGSAAAALGRIADPRAVGQLIHTLDDAASNVRRSAAIALGCFADKLSGPAIRKTLRVLIESSTSQARLSLRQVVQILLRTLFRTADLDSIRESLREVEGASRLEDVWRPHGIALNYLSSGRDPAILEQQQPEMREAVMLLVGLYDEGLNRKPRELTPPLQATT